MLYFHLRVWFNPKKCCLQSLSWEMLKGERQLSNQLPLHLAHVSIVDEGEGDVGVGGDAHYLRPIPKLVSWPASRNI